MKDHNIRSRWTVSFWMIALLPCITAFLIYVGSLKAPFIFDDYHKIIDNPDITGQGSIFGKLLYPYSVSEDRVHRNDPSRPVLYLTFRLNYLFGGLDTSGWHLVNNIIHSLNALLAFLFVYRLCCLYGGGACQQIAVLVSLYFAVHPVNADAVAYIMGRSNLLAFFFLYAFHPVVYRSVPKQEEIFLYPVCLYVPAGSRF